MRHVPVLLNEVVEVLNPRDGGRYFDGTLGYGGHARAILEKSSPTGELAGTDLDKGALARVEDELSPYRGRIHLFHGNYTEIDRVCSMVGWDRIDGVLLDLGMSSTALDDPSRGFSFLREGPLDMRFSTDAELTAGEVVNTYEESRLADIIWKYGEERFSRRIARAILQARPVLTTTRLADIVSSSIPRRLWPKKIHPATRTFQALRMEVNHEIESLEEFLPKAANLLSIGGVMAIISFHSLEDRVVKQFFAGGPGEFIYPRGLPAPARKTGPVFEKITRKPVIPGELETEENPRARSSKLRAARRAS